MAKWQFCLADNSGGPYKGATTETVPEDEDLIRALYKVEKDSLFPQSPTAKHGCNLHAAHLETPTEECPHMLPTHTCFCSSFLVLTPCARDDMGLNRL